MKVYVDGCSYTAGTGLDRCFSLANLIHTQGHEVVDKSRLGKSNYSMVLDLHAEKETYDLYVIGWTYAHRIEYLLDTIVVDGAVGRVEIGLGDHVIGDFLEKEYKELNTRFFKYISRFDALSDFFVDSCAALLSGNNYKFFSWQKRNCATQLIYPKFDQHYRQQNIKNWQDVAHLNEAGMIKLCEMILVS